MVVKIENKSDDLMFQSGICVKESQTPLLQMFG